MGLGLWEGAGSGVCMGADREEAVSRVFGERMRAGAVLVGAGEVRRDVGIDCFRVGCGIGCWTVGGLVAEWKVEALVRGRWRLF